MHIALMSPAWPPGNSPNGIVTYVHFMKAELAKQGHRITVLAETLAAGTRENGVYPVTSTMPERLATSLRSRLLGRRRTVFDHGWTIASALNRIHARDPIDVFEMEESFGWAAQVANATDIPIVVKLHGPAFLHLMEEELATPFGQEKVAREGEALKQLPVMTAPSRWTLSQSLARYELTPAVAEHVVNPLEPALGSRLWDLDQCDRNTLVFIGRFDKVKGADVLIQAFQRLLVDRPDLKLIFVGPDRGLVNSAGGSWSEGI
jgi:glycosyltransferase involved in cell wall biosynthesis